jgi:hypothetical protein
MTEPTPPDGREPAATPAAAAVAVLLAVALLAVGLLAGREFLVVRGVFHGRPWLRDALAWLGRITWHGWLWPVSIAAVVLGLVLLAAAVKPRGRRHLPTRGEPVLWLRPTDIARASTAAALRVPGVQRAHTTSGRRRVDVHAFAHDDAQPLGPTIRDEVATALAELRTPPRVRVHVAVRADAHTGSAARP